MMKDLVDTHRANIAKAGVTLAEKITAATSDYSAEVAASEAALAIHMEKRIDAFNGTQPEPKSAAEKRIDTMNEVMNKIPAQENSETVKTPD